MMPRSLHRTQHTAEHFTNEIARLFCCPGRTRRLLPGNREHIYIAGRYSLRDEFRRVRDILNKRGFLVTSRWLDENEPLDSQMGEQSTEWYCQTQRG